MNSFTDITKYKRKILVVLGGLTMLSGIYADSNNQGRWSLSAEYVWGQTHRIEVLASGSIFANYSASFTPLEAGLPALVGDVDRVSNRFYDDGFVGLIFVNGTQITTDDQAMTTYWGYDHQSQLVGDSLVFTATGNESRRLGAEKLSLFENATTNRSARNAFPAIRLSRFWNSSDGRFEYGVRSGFRWFSDSSSSPEMRVMDYSQQIELSRVSVTDTYDLGGIVAPLPPYVGPLAPPGPIIDNLVTSREVSEASVGTETRYFRAISNTSSEFKSRQFALGFSVAFRNAAATMMHRRDSEPVSDRFKLQLSALRLEGGLLWDHIDFQFSEYARLMEHDGLPQNPISSELHESIYRTKKYILGAYTSAEVQVALNARHSQFITIAIRYEGSDPVSFQAGGSKAHLEMGGWTMRTAFELQF